MRKTILTILIIIISFIGVLKLGTYLLASKIENKEQLISSIWKQLDKNIEDNNLYIQSIYERMPYLPSDSLVQFTFYNHDKKKYMAYVEHEYHINKIMIKILNDSLVENVTKTKINQNVSLLNNLAEKYNESVLDYNSFIRSFPINLYTYKKYKTKDYFDLKYGSENKHPKKKYEEIPKWMLELEKSKGYD